MRTYLRTLVRAHICWLSNADLLFENAERSGHLWSYNMPRPRISTTTITFNTFLSVLSRSSCSPTKYIARRKAIRKPFKNQKLQLFPYERMTGKLLCMYSTDNYGDLPPNAVFSPQFSALEIGQYLLFIQ